MCRDLNFVNTFRSLFALIQLQNSCLARHFVEINLSSFRDQGKTNDFIGTAYLHLSAISGQGDLGEGKQHSFLFLSFFFFRLKKRDYLRALQSHNDTQCFLEIVIWLALYTFWHYSLIIYLKMHAV